MRRIPELDAFRAVAVVMVLAFHSLIFLLNYPKVVGFMWAGVDLFFVLSGYLITAIILRSQDEPGFLRNFYMRRSIRIWPIYYLLIASVTAAAAVGGGPRITGELLARFLTFTQSVPFSAWANESYRPLCHLWSLAVEEQFYLVWPLLTLILPRRYLAAVLVASAGVAVAIRGLELSPMQTITARCDGLALGSLLALVLNSRRWRGRPPASFVPWFAGCAALAVLGLVAFRASSPILRSRAGISIPGSYKFTLDLLTLDILYACSVGIVVCLSGHPRLRLLRNPLLCHVGTISYGIYLYHCPIFFWVESALGTSPAATALAWASTFAVAELSWRFIEAPFLSLKRRFEYHRGDSTSLPASKPREELTPVTPSRAP